MRAEEYDYIDSIYEQCEQIKNQESMTPKELKLENIYSVVGGLIILGLLLYFIIK